MLDVVRATFDDKDLLSLIVAHVAPAEIHEFVCGGRDYCIEALPLLRTSAALRAASRRLQAWLPSRRAARSASG